VWMRWGAVFWGLGRPGAVRWSMLSLLPLRWVRGRAHSALPAGGELTVMHLRLGSSSGSARVRSSIHVSVHIMLEMHRL